MHKPKAVSVFYLGVAIWLVLESISQEDALGTRKTNPKFPAFHCLLGFFFLWNDSEYSMVYSWTIKDGFFVNLFSIASSAAFGTFLGLLSTATQQFHRISFVF